MGQRALQPCNGRGVPGSTRPQPPVIHDISAYVGLAPSGLSRPPTDQGRWGPSGSTRALAPSCRGRSGGESAEKKAPEKACKPGPVSRAFARPDDHFSRTPVTRRLKRPYPRAPRGPRFTHTPSLRPTRGSLSYLTLLRVGFTEPARSPAPLVSSYLTVSPLPRGSRRAAVCFLWHWSVGSPPLAVSQHPALRSPDFPPARVAPRRRSSGLLWCQSKSASKRGKV